jgi:hypothetical protein
MNTLDFGAIMERDGWYDDYDLSCPLCDGGCRRYEQLTAAEKDQVRVAFARSAEADETGLFLEGWRRITGCRKGPHELLDKRVAAVVARHFPDADIADYYRNHNAEFDFTCAECNEGLLPLDVVWNTAFGVDCRYTPDNRRRALEQGFLLIEHGGSCYLVMLSCGYDNTWGLHHCRWLLQNRQLDEEACRACLHSGGHVFLHTNKEEFIQYVVQRTGVDAVETALHQANRTAYEAARLAAWETYAAQLNGAREKLPLRSFLVTRTRLVQETVRVRATTPWAALRRGEAVPVGEPRAPVTTRACLPTAVTPAPPRPTRRKAT